MRARVFFRLAFALTVALALLPMTAPGDADAADLDSACLPSSDTNDKGASHSLPLKTLTSCTKLLCRTSAKEANRDNVRFIDEALTTYHARNLALSEAVDEYQVACRLLLKNFCQACGPMDRVNSAVLRIQMKGAEAEESAALLRFHEGFSPFSRIVAQDENDLSCSWQIKSLSNNSVELHSAAVLRFANTKCDE